MNRGLGKAPSFFIAWWAVKPHQRDGPRALVGKAFCETTRSRPLTPGRNRNASNASALEVTESQEIYGNVRPSDSAC